MNGNIRFVHHYYIIMAQKNQDNVSVISTKRTVRSCSDSPFSRTLTEDCSVSLVIIPVQTIMRLTVIIDYRLRELTPGGRYRFPGRGFARGRCAKGLCRCLVGGSGAWYSRFFV